MVRYLYFRTSNNNTEDIKFYVDLSAGLKRMAEEVRAPLGIVEAKWRDGRVYWWKYETNTNYSLREVEVF